MYCGNCLRDNALVAQLRALGHEVVMVPMYLPLTLDEADQTGATPIFFSGINVYLEQESAAFARAPGFLRRLLASRPLLKWAANRAAKTRASDLGEITLSMLKGLQGRQARELTELTNWLKTQPRPDVVCLSNALLLGLSQPLKEATRAALVCTLQGEDFFLNSLPEPYRTQCWEAVANQGRHVDLFIAPSCYFGNLMRERLQIPPERLRVIYNGINLSGFETETSTPKPQPALGYLARMAPEKGLEVLVDAFIILKERGRFPLLRLRLAGSCLASDEPFVTTLRRKLEAKGLLNCTDFCPNLDRSAKLNFLRSLSVFSVPATYGEAFGLYLIEAMAMGVPVVQPRCASFPELLEQTGGGLLCEPGDPVSLAEKLETLLSDERRARALGETGRKAVFEKFSVATMAAQTVQAYQSLTNQPATLK